MIIGNLVGDSYRAFDIRESDHGPSHIFLNNNAMGDIEVSSNLDGVLTNPKENRAGI